MKPNELTIRDARERLDQGKLTAVELTQACLKAIKRFDRRVHACLSVDEKGALEAAAAADRRLSAGERSPLLGIPFLAKDNIMTKGLRTTAASKMLENYVAPYDATIIERLKKEGAILLGKTNLDEFAHGSSTEYSAFGATKNPWDLSRVPGGSSGGSAAAVAAGFCLFALGTDTGGSVRHPASFCGIVGLKPTYGLCSRFGLIAMTSSTDVPGCLVKTTDDAGLVLSALAGFDPRDATTSEVRLPDYTTIEPSLLKKMKIGLPKELKDVKLDPAVRKAFDRLKNEIKKAGGKLVDVSLPSTAYALAAYYVITPSEVSSNLARFDGLRFGGSKAKTESYETAREKGLGPEAKRRIMLGTYCLSAGYYDAYYVRAQKIRTKIISEFEKAFKRCDVILTPTTPTVAFKLGAKKAKPLNMYLEDAFSVPASLAGLPAISVPAAKKPLPTGFQLIAPSFEEKLLLGVARACESLAVDQDLAPNL